MEQKEIVVLIFAAFAAIALMCIGFVAILFIHRNRKVNYQNEKKIMSQLHEQILLSTQIEMQTQTMQYIGREIHDNIGQKLTLASLYTQQLAYENKAPQINDKIENISSIINESLSELRQLSKSLTDDSIAGNTITDLIQQECERVNNTKKCCVHFSSNQKNFVLPYQTKSILLRIVQEFLQNSIKHSGCKNIEISLSVNDNTNWLLLKDDGKGFDLTKISGNGIGLNNMKKRAELIGGTFNLESIAGSGTKLDIEIPLQKNQ
jgi:signal transduction histidine kinase